jgi:hypothetical protein
MRQNQMKFGLDQKIEFYFFKLHHQISVMAITKVAKNVVHFALYVQK